MVMVDLIHEILRDSPKFRENLAYQESQIELLESKLEKVVKMCGLMIDAGKTYVSQQSLFANSLWELSGCFKGDSSCMSSLTKVVHSLQEMNKYQTILLDQAARTILKNLSTLLKEDVSSVWEMRRQFNKVSGELDVALTRHSQTVRSKPLEIELSENQLKASQASFRHCSMDYVYAALMLQAKKKHEIIATLLSYLHACSTYFHQGSDLCEGMAPLFADLSKHVCRQREEGDKLEKSLSERHVIIEKESPGVESPMQGYLFKRTSNAFKSWHRRWFSLANHQLVYTKRTGESASTIMEEDLKLCTVRPLVNFERRFCFQIISPTSSHILQADNEQAYNQWLTSLQEGIGSALQESMKEGHHSQREIRNNNNNPQSKNTRLCDRVRKVLGNERCCDCGLSGPTWASINLGITLCIECSGIHRSLGVHYSKVRSLTLDSWEPEVVKVMLELGNSLVNRIYEAELPQDFPRIDDKSNRSERERFIRQKWVNKSFVGNLEVRKGSPKEGGRKWSVRRARRRGRSREDTSLNRSSVLMMEADDDLPIPQPVSSDEASTSGDESSPTVGEEEMCKLSPTLLLYKACAAHNLPVMCRALALQADLHWTDPEQQAMGHLHQAVLSGSAMACEYLILNGAQINGQDIMGRTPLHLAVQHGNTGQVSLFLKHKANQHIRDLEGSEPLDTAVRIANADIATLLRLGRLNEEMTELEASGGDETFNDFVRDLHASDESEVSSPLLGPS